MEQLKQMMCGMFHISNTETLKSIYFAYFHSIMKYGIIFWGNASYSKKIFTLQKKIVRLMAGAKPRDRVKISSGDQRSYLSHVNIYSP
jgi:hypothetical protein